MLFREHTPQRRDNIEEKKKYRDYRIPLREDFNYRCGYCDDRDFPRVEYFEIDHLIPQKIMKVKKDNDYKNLVYACHSCNNAKRAKWPSRDENISIIGEKGWIDPCSGDYAKQFERDDCGRIVPITPIGKWMYDNLKLYKSQHQVLWNLEQLDVLSDTLEQKIEGDNDNVILYKQFYLLTKKIREWSKKLYQQ